MLNRLTICLLAILIFIVGMIVVYNLIDYLVYDKLTKIQFNKKMHECRMYTTRNYKFISISQVEKIYESNAYLENKMIPRYSFNLFYIYDHLYDSYLFFADYKEYKKYFHFVYHVVHRCKGEPM